MDMYRRNKKQIEFIEKVTMKLIKKVDERTPAGETRFSDIFIYETVWSLIPEIRMQIEQIRWNRVTRSSVKRKLEYEKLQKAIISKLVKKESDAKLQNKKKPTSKLAKKKSVAKRRNRKKH